MQHFQYVPKSQWSPYYKEVLKLIHDVQNDLRPQFTFQYRMIGSASRNMITMDPHTNVGFDFDFNLIINNPKSYSAKYFKEMLIKHINRHSSKYRYSPAEDSTRVITIKVKDQKNSKILHSVDFAIVYDDVKKNGNKISFYLHYDKHTGEYLWEKQLANYYLLPDKIEFCKRNNLWANVKDLYLKNKNTNTDPNQKSREIFSQTINTICQRNGYRP